MSRDVIYKIKREWRSSEFTGIHIWKGRLTKKAGNDTRDLDDILRCQCRTGTRKQPPTKPTGFKRFCVTSNAVIL